MICIAGKCGVHVLASLKVLLRAGVHSEDNCSYDISL